MDRRTTIPPALPRAQIYVGWIGVGWQRHCAIFRPIFELDSQGTAFCVFWRSVTAGDHVRSLEGNDLYSTQVGMIMPGRGFRKAPKRQLRSTPNAGARSSYTGY